MLRVVFTVSMLIASPAFGQTADQEARFFTAIKAMEAQSYAYYTSVDDRFAPLLAPVAEGEEFRNSQRCVLARIEQDGGMDMLEEYIAATEKQSATKITSLAELGRNLPKVMVDDLVFAASAECGPMSHTTKQMMTPEFMKLMDDPEVMQRLMGM